MHAEEIEGRLGTAHLEIRIFHDADARTLTVFDTANGMERSELRPTIRLNRPPEDTTGRSEFGMGLKTAACWLGDRWTVTTKQLGSVNEYEVVVDVNDLAEAKPESVRVHRTTDNDPERHYTRVHVEEMHRVFKGRTVGKIKDYLASMYRRDLASGRVSIYYNEELLRWDDDPIHSEMLPDGDVRIWKKDIATQVDGHDVSGWVGIRMPGSAYRAGLQLFRRGRVVLGGPGQGWKPAEIFGAPNTFQSQRLIGELDMDTFPVTQAKDGFDWDGGLEGDLVAALQPLTADYVEKI